MLRGLGPEKFQHHILADNNTPIQYFYNPYSNVGGVTTKESFCLTSGNKVFKQLANFGEPKTGIITGQTYGDLIEPSAYLGSSMASATFISQVELDFETDQEESTTIGLDWTGNFQTALIPNTADLVGWDTTFTLLPTQGNFSNVAQTISHNQGARILNLVCLQLLI